MLSNKLKDMVEPTLSAKKTFVPKLHGQIDQFVHIFNRVFTRGNEVSKSELFRFPVAKVGPAFTAIEGDGIYRKLQSFVPVLLLSCKEDKPAMAYAALREHIDVTVTRYRDMLLLDDGCRDPCRG